MTNNNIALEPDKHYMLRLRNLGNLGLGSPGTMNITVVDDNSKNRITIFEQCLQYQVNTLKTIKLLSVTVVLLIAFLKLMESVSELLIVVIELVEVILDILHSVGHALVSNSFIAATCKGRFTLHMLVTESACRPMMLSM